MMNLSKSSALASWLEVISLGFKLAKRDIRGGTAGFRMFILALGLGVAAISAVGSIRVAIETSIARDARILLGGDAELRLVQRLPEAEQLDFFNQNANKTSSTLSLRAMAYADNGERTLIEVEAVDENYPLYGEVKMEEGSPEFNQIHAKLSDGVLPLMAAPAILEKLKIKLGDEVSIGDATFKLVGIISKIPDKSNYALDLGPQVTLSLNSLEKTNLVLPGSIYRHYTRLIFNDGVDFEEFKSDVLKGFPDMAYRVRGLDEAAPSVQRFIDRVGSFLTLVSLATLIIGGVGAANAVKAFLKQRANSIATLKCLGAPSRLIFMIYLMEALFMASIGIALGLLVGAGSLFAVSPLLATLMPIAAKIGIYPIPLITAAALGFLVTLLFTLWSLGQAAAIPAADLFRGASGVTSGYSFGKKPPKKILFALGIIILALLAVCYLTTPDKRITFWFLGGISGLLVLFAMIGWLCAWLARQIPHQKFVPLRLALAGLNRPGTPAIAVAVSLGIGLTVLLAVADLQANLNNQLKSVTEADSPSLFVLDLQPNQMERFSQIIEDYGQEVTLKDPSSSPISHDQTPLLRGMITALKEVSVDKITPPEEFQWVLRGDRGFTWSATPPLTGDTKITEGEWWAEDYAGPSLVSFDAEAAEAFGLKLGDSVEINLLGRKITATIANLRKIDWASLNINFLMVFSPAPLATAPQSYLASIMVDAKHESQLERKLTDEFNNISVIKVREILTSVTTLVGQLALAVQAIALIALGAGLIVLAGAILAEQSQRLKDLVILKTLGATRIQQLTAWLIEYGLIALLASLLAAIAGSGASFFVVTYIMEGQYQIQPLAIITVLLLAILVVIPFGMIAGLKILSESPLRHLRNN